MFETTCTLENGLYISIDYLAFTIKKDMLPENVISFFGLDKDDFQTGLNGSYGYKSRLRHSIYPISILYDGNDDMGIHVDVTGSAIGFFIQSYRNKNTNCPTPFGNTAYSMDSFETSIISDLLQDIIDIGTLTRLDIAVDDKGCNYYSMDELAEIFDKGLYVSKFKKYREDKEKTKAKKTGHTIYLGSRKSEIMFRIYDKQLEQSSKKNLQTDAWVRWEMELHKHRAKAVAMFLITGNDLSSVAIGVFSSYLRFIVQDNTRDSRCSTSEKWAAFICGIQKVRLCQPIPEKTADEKKNWMLTQVAPTAAAIYKIDGDLSFFYDMIEKGSLRFSKELIHIIQKEGGAA